MARRRHPYLARVPNAWQVGFVAVLIRQHPLRKRFFQFHPQLKHDRGNPDIGIRFRKAYILRGL
jgi:hypothetical protein